MHIKLGPYPPTNYLKRLAFGYMEVLPGCEMAAASAAPGGLNTRVLRFHEAAAAAAAAGLPA
jgi:hypothetical protein